MISREGAEHAEKNALTDSASHAALRELTSGLVKLIE